MRLMGYACLAGGAIKTVPGAATPAEHLLGQEREHLFLPDHRVAGLRIQWFLAGGPASGSVGP